MGAKLSYNENPNIATHYIASKLTINFGQILTVVNQKCSILNIDWLLNCIKSKIILVEDP